MNFDFHIELGKITPKIAEGAKIYILGAKSSWEHICNQYKHLVNVDLNIFIDGFIVNDKNDQNNVFCDKPVYTLSEIEIMNAVILISSPSYSDSTYEMARQLSSCGMFWRHSYFTSEIFMTILMRYEYQRMLKFQNVHKNKRCFIVGNGPSLTTGDLDKIKDEISFGSNEVYLLYEKTSWRPSYYVIHDSDRLKRIQNQIHENINCPRFYAFNSVFDIEPFFMNGEFDYFYYLDGIVDWFPLKDYSPDFSSNPFKLSWGATVTYDAIQLAFYMGFSEIHLLGMDHDYAFMINTKGDLITRDVASDNFSSKYTPSVHPLMVDLVDASYENANEYAKKHGIKIYNATRGGKLEMFERIDFDALF
ncbi:MAG: DUF115 domain-containing protein [Defluviitaleaceae bacterium]|nr:DUF115 domain-containing protein [Defluviitaleaceae bacterium]